MGLVVTVSIEGKLGYGNGPTDASGAASGGAAKSTEANGASKRYP